MPYNKRDIVIKQQEKIKELIEQSGKMKKALKFLIEHSPHDGENSACMYCDMGGSGYSSKGDNNHDDIKHVCPVVVAKEALEGLS
jgi:hypothetical protein